jgi:hypothetical protein
MSDAASLAPSLISRFERMVRRDGGSVRLMGVEGSVIRVGYLPGSDPDCAEGVCVLPEVELQAMMTEVLAAMAPDLQVEVKRLAE